ncbi:ABC transporter ATP-binding protein [Paracoccus lutimaris]|uniref:Phospholipid/cholesterol/gamma-HCH transport system ATP-binding protein n=1 Tax=Paracoccus lutimaris TaxID=1490030 RepID=A0A368Z8I0_9RHOB|nr:ATP-binding cassette domain-containing protein [Paracoccus lutimaris]RCW88701.1 phospholipid/cholesterol/gamma-HCH transport system ATP-binding protein [Paracoccus lutimaris]
MLSVRGLSKTFGPKRVLDGVDLDLATGESLVVIGGSGTGKSVLLRCILGLETPDAGEILWRDRPLAEGRAEFMDEFGMLFQNAALFDSLPVWRNVAFRLLRQMPKARARDIAVEKLARVGLGPEVADLYPAELSGGMRKRAGLARAIAADPRVIFFDEPTTGLDPIRAATINELIRGIVDETGATAITITHDMSSVRAIADRVALLDRGRLRWQGTVAQMDTAQDDYLRDFIAGRARPMARGPALDLAPDPTLGRE